MSTGCYTIWAINRNSSRASQEQHQQSSRQQQQHQQMHRNRQHQQVLNARHDAGQVPPQSPKQWLQDAKHAEDGTLLQKRVRSLRRPRRQQ